MDIKINERALEWYKPRTKKIKLNFEIEVDVDLYVLETLCREINSVKEDIVQPIVKDIEYKSIDDHWIVKVVRATQLLEKPIERT